MVNISFVNLFSVLQRGTLFYINLRFEAESFVLYPSSVKFGAAHGGRLLKTLPARAVGFFLAKVQIKQTLNQYPIL